MSKIKQLASILINHSVKLQKGENLVLEASIESKPLIKEIIKLATEKEAFVQLNLIDDEFNSYTLKNSQVNGFENYKDFYSIRKQSFEKMDAYIAIRAETNEFNSVNVDQSIISEVQKINSDSLTTRLSKKWVVLRWPTPASAQKAQMSFDDYKDFCFDAMCVDYKKMDDAQTPLVELMNKTDKVKIVGPGTNLEFSIKGIPTIKCAGEYNIPDGEVFTAPTLTSTNGTIKFNTYSILQGKKWENIELTFENGQIVKATCDNQPEQELNKIFDQDKGARFVGEFSLGINNFIQKPVGEILYDEKIGGSIHFTPGRAYEEADNTNKSVLHWDLVLIQTPEFGGGEIYFDDVLVRKDGKFVVDSLLPLND